MHIVQVSDGCKCQAKQNAFFKYGYISHFQSKCHEQTPKCGEGYTTRNIPDEAISHLNCNYNNNNNSNNNKKVVEYRILYCLLDPMIQIISSTDNKSTTYMGDAVHMI